MKGLGALAFLTIALILLLIVLFVSGGCHHASDTAADGSRCGGRSSDSRPGGN
nr:transmembrane anchored protein [Pantoea vagans]